jgi:hypothetical protein
MRTLSVAGTFVATGNMTNARQEATATLLADGDVLIAGGVDLISTPMYHPIGLAEIYDPSSGIFTRTGSMTTPRSDASAVLLTDGRVLIVGGWGCQDPARCTADNWAGQIQLSSAEIYNPATERFTRTGSMSEVRYDATALRLSDGIVLVVSGYTRVVEAYNPWTGRFTRVGTLTRDYDDGMVAALLPTGKVLVVGPDSAGLGVEVFDPDTGRSRSIPSPISDVSGDVSVGTATSLHDGRVLVQFSNSTDFVNHLFIYDPATDAFMTAGSFEGAGGWNPLSAVLLADGRVLFAGGGSNQGLGVADLAGLYDPATGFHLLGAKMTIGRAYQTMTALPDGTVLIAGGGGSDSPQPLSSAELFTP